MLPSAPGLDCCVLRVVVVSAGRSGPGQIIGWYGGAGTARSEASNSYYSFKVWAGPAAGVGPHSGDTNTISTKESTKLGGIFTIFGSFPCYLKKDSVQTIYYLLRH